MRPRNHQLESWLGAIGAIPCVLVAVDARAADPVDGVAIHAQLQTWATVVDQDENPQADPAGYGDPEADPGVSIHRARIGVEGAKDALSWDVTVGYSEPYDALEAFASPSGIGLVNAWGAWKLDLGDSGDNTLAVSAGLQKVPFAREELISSGDLVFQERSVASQWLSPGYEVGLLADLVTAPGISAKIGVYNGNGALDGDNNVGKLIVGRAEWATGDTYRTWSPKGENAFGIGASVQSNTDVATGTLGLNVDALARLHRVTALVQVTREDQQPRNVDIAPPPVLAGTVRQGALAQLSYFQPLPTDTNAGRGIEFALRGSLFNASTSQLDNGDVGIFHVGATYRDVLPGFDLGAGFIHRQELGGRAIPNDTVRLWAQLRAKQTVTGVAEREVPVMAAWRTDFIGTWKAGGDLDGAVIALWEQPGLGLVGSFQMMKPKGKVVVGRPYPLDSFMYADRTLRVRMDPYGEGRDVVWFELSPSQDGQLCGYGYEDSRRADAVGGTGGGSWICWSQTHLDPATPEVVP